MRLAATLQAVRKAPGALTAREVVWMATGKAPARSGSRPKSAIEAGKKADLILLDRDRPHLCPSADPWSAIVYSARGTDVRTVLVDGDVRPRLRPDPAGCRVKQLRPPGRQRPSSPGGQVCNVVGYNVLAVPACEC